MPIESQPKLVANESIDTEYINIEYNTNLIVTVNSANADIPFVCNQYHSKDTTYFKDLSTQNFICPKFQCNKTSLKCLLDVQESVFCNTLETHVLTAPEVHAENIFCEKTKGTSLTVDEFVCDQVNCIKFKSENVNAQEGSVHTIQSGNIQTTNSSFSDLAATSTECDVLLCNTIATAHIHTGLLDTNQLLWQKKQILPAKPGALTCKNGALQWTDTFADIQFSNNILTINNLHCSLPTQHQSANDHGTQFSDITADIVAVLRCDTTHVHAQSMDVSNMYTNSISATNWTTQSVTANVNADEITIQNLNCNYSSNKVCVVVNNTETYLDVPIENHDVNACKINYSNLELLDAKFDLVQVEKIVCNSTYSASLNSKTADEIICSCLTIDTLPYRSPVLAVDHRKIHLIDGTVSLNLPIQHQFCNNEGTHFSSAVSAENCTADKCETGKITCNEACTVNAQTHVCANASNTHINDFVTIHWNNHLLVAPAVQSMMQFCNGKIHYLATNELGTNLRSMLETEIRKCRWPFQKQRADESTTYFDCDVQCSDIEAHNMNTKVLTADLINAAHIQTHELHIKACTTDKFTCNRLNLDNCTDFTYNSSLEYTDGIITFKLGGATCNLYTPFKNQTHNENKTSFTNTILNNAACSHLDCTNIDTTKATAGTFHAEAQDCTSAYAQNITTEDLQTTSLKCRQLDVSYNLQSIHADKKICLTYNNNMTVSIDGWPFRHMSASERLTNFANTLHVDKLSSETVSADNAYTDSITIDSCNCDSVQGITYTSDTISVSQLLNCVLPHNIPMNAPDFDAVLACDGHSVFWKAL